MARTKQSCKKSAGLRPRLQSGIETQYRDNVFQSKIEWAIGQLAVKQNVQECLQLCELVTSVKGCQRNYF
jgi:hypothetical protein